MEQIAFFGKRTPLSGIDKVALKQTLKETARKHGLQIERINYILLDDPGILAINLEHLQHDYFTDIITFDLGMLPNQILSDIYIGYETVASNAIKFGSEPTEEMLRVLFHGLLHLCGFKDKTPAEQKQMRSKEAECLTLYQQKLELKSPGST